jgi:hypothetical protein
MVHVSTGQFVGAIRSPGVRPQAVHGLPRPSAKPGEPWEGGGLVAVQAGGVSRFG